MGIKFRPTVVKTVKQANGTTAKTNEHSYMSAASVEAITDMLNASNTPNKKKDKLRKELVRRRVPINEQL
jgi:ABC-type branched-subunit amino acid transport system substrate-binding protein